MSSKEKMKSKAYVMLGLFILMATYYLSTYGFTFGLKEPVQQMFLGVNTGMGLAILVAFIGISKL